MKRKKNTAQSAPKVDAIEPMALPTFIGTSAKVLKHHKSGNLYTRHTAGAYGLTTTKRRPLEAKLELVATLAKSAKVFKSSHEKSIAFGAFIASYRNADKSKKDAFRAALGAYMAGIPAYAPYLNKSGDGELLDTVGYDKLAHFLFDLDISTIREMTAKLAKSK